MTSIDFLNKVHKSLDSQEYSLSYSPRVRKENDQTVLRGGVLCLDGLDVLANGIDKAHRPPSLSAMAMRLNKV